MKIVSCPNCGQRTSGDYCQWCKYPIMSGSPVRRHKAEKHIERQHELEPAYQIPLVAEPAQTRRGVLGSLKEKLREKTRDELCAALCALGLDARMAERGRTEEMVGLGMSGKSLGIIDILGGPIQWVQLRRHVYGGGQGGWWVNYFTDYGVPYHSLERNLPRLRIKSVRKKAFPLLGPVVGLHWKGEDSGLGIISRLNSDSQLKQPIMRSRDVKIRTSSYLKCLIIQIKTRQAPSRELWSCYQAIARHLLAE